MTRIAIFNVKFSPNLGDGLLSECLERELKELVEGVTVASLDLAGRRGYGATVPHRQLALRLLEASPAVLRQAAARLALGNLARRHLRPYWRSQLVDCDCAIIGGGNLFADADLNFPIKINAACEAIAHRGIPVAVFGVGVTRNWSQEGRRLFTRGLATVDLVDASVRDRRSQLIWNELLTPADIREATLAHDPGLLTARHFPSARHRDNGIGFCITDPVALRYHAAPGAVADDLLVWYSDAIGALSAAGRKVTLFTNGSPEDEAFLDLHRGRWASHPNIFIESVFGRPAQLAHFISGCDLVIAHRMHACIAALSYGIPTIGLAWDKKLDSFFARVHRNRWLLDPATIAAADIPAGAAEAISEGVDSAMLERLIEECRADVARLAALLVPAGPQQ